MANYLLEGKMPAWITAVMGVLAFGGQAVNVFLNLKLRNAVLESEKHTLDKVGRDFKRTETCQAEMKAVDTRLYLLE
jgi:hypothetical protein